MSMRNHFHLITVTEKGVNLYLLVLKPMGEDTRGRPLILLGMMLLLAVFNLLPSES
jgi:hypothetical protein